MLPDGGFFVSVCIAGWLAGLLLSLQPHISMRSQRILSTAETVQMEFECAKIPIIVLEDSPGSREPRAANVDKGLLGSLLVGGPDASMCRRSNEDEPIEEQFGRPHGSAILMLGVKGLSPSFALG